jgi:antitoxin YefM
MDVLNYSEARANFAHMLDKVNEDHTPILITRQGGKPAVLISLDDFNAWQETAYLMQSPANRRMLRQAMDELDAGGGTERELQEPQEAPKT